MNQTMSQKAVVIAANGHAEVKQLDGWNGIKTELNGGYLELVPLSDDVVLYVDEDGIAKGLPRNDLATTVVRNALAKVGRTLLPGDYIKGTAVFVGQAESDDPEEGMVESDLPQDFITYVRRHLRL
jgi:hypothetical protein